METKTEKVGPHSPFCSVCQVESTVWTAYGESKFTCPYCKKDVPSDHKDCVKCKKCEK